MKIMERKYISKNGVVERTRYAVGNQAQPRGRRRKGRTSLRKQEQNFNTALRKVARILNCNYGHENGLLITLDYCTEGLKNLIAKLPDVQQAAIRNLKLPKSTIGAWTAPKESERKREKTQEKREELEKSLQSLWDLADHQMVLWLRRIRRKYGAKLKALMITSDVDHETGELVRLHHHVVLAAEGISWDLLRDEWKFGSADIRQLRQQPDYTPIAVYLMRQVRKQPEKKKYHVSQGMEQPVLEERVLLSHAEIKAPAGAKVFERSEFQIDCIGQYIRYLPTRSKKSALRREGGAADDIPENP